MQTNRFTAIIWLPRSLHNLSKQIVHTIYCMYLHCNVMSWAFVCWFKILTAVIRLKTEPLKLKAAKMRRLKIAIQMCSLFFSLPHKMLFVSLFFSYFIVAFVASFCSTWCIFKMYRHQFIRTIKRDNIGTKKTVAKIYIHTQTVWQRKRKAGAKRLSQNDTNRENLKQSNVLLNSKIGLKNSSVEFGVLRM